jgi:hypothetical protein
MNVLSYSRRLVKRQDVMKQRRSFSMPKAWKFSHDKVNFYLKFDEKLAKRLYNKRKYNRPVQVKWYV